MMRDPGTVTDSFDLQRVRDMSAWLRDTITATKILAERAGGHPAVWRLQPSDHQFVNLVRRRPDSSIDHAVTWGGAEGAMTRPEAEHAARHDPHHELGIATFHLALLDQHAVEETLISVQEGQGVKRVPWATCAYCDTGNPYEAPHMGYPCPTIRGLLNAHCRMPGFDSRWSA
jgi:hypothetical protein